MANESFSNKRNLKEDTVTDLFLQNPTPESFSALFNIFTPQLVSFFRARSRELALAEDLAQEVMLTVYLKAGQVRDRASFRAWLFKIARNALCRHLKRAIERLVVHPLSNLVATEQISAGDLIELDYESEWPNLKFSKVGDGLALQTMTSFADFDVPAHASVAKAA
jgi:DNA-directed RNA polymerase specialized sigma24 family protein